VSIENFAEGVRMARAMADKFGGGWVWQLEKLVACHSRLLDLSPIQAGDTVALTKTPEISESKSWGWLGGKHYLVKGERAKVARIEIGHGGEWRYYLNFENETWIDSYTGKKNKPSTPADYGFDEDYIVKVKP
jgi:hypothetical protein